MIYVLQKDNFFHINYNKIVKVNKKINNEYCLIVFKRMRLTFLENGSVESKENKEKCLAKIVKTKDKIVYLEIEGMENE